MDAAAISPNLFPFSQMRNPGVPSHFGSRFDAGGHFLPEPGNTVVCHLVAGSETQKVLVDARARFLAMPEAAMLAFTPISSLHMTLFQGVIETRRKPGYWPPELPLDTPIDDTTAVLEQRLGGFHGGPAFRMRVAEALPTGLVLVGASETDRQALKTWRDRLADLFGYRHPDHDGYEFHITFAYVIKRFDDEALFRWQKMLAEVAEGIRQRADVLALSPPAFCSFEDMNHFEELLVIEPQG